MPGELAHRFVFGGNLPFEAHVPGTLEHEVTAGSADRERQQIAIAKAQVAATLLQAKSIKEISTTLEAELRTSANRLQRSIDQGFAQLSSDIYELQCVLHADLTEIRWALAEQTEVLREILNVLRKPRQVQAQEIVADGRRHLQRGYYEDAEQLFEHALRKIRGDFEALFSLGLARIQLDKPEGALDAFERAVSFAPDDLPVAKAEALSSYARTLFCVGDYLRAANLSSQILALREGIPGRLYEHSMYRTSVYSARAGDVKRGLKQLQDLIGEAPRYLAIAVSDRDWGSAANDVQGLADSLREDKVAEALRRTSPIEAAIKRGDFAPEPTRVLGECAEHLRLLLNGATYEEVLRLILLSESLGELAGAGRQMTNLPAKIAENEARLEAQQARHKEARDVVSNLHEVRARLLSDHKRRVDARASKRKKLMGLGISMITVGGLAVEAGLTGGLLLLMGGVAILYSVTRGPGEPRAVPELERGTAEYKHALAQLEATQVELGKVRQSQRSRRAGLRHAETDFGRLSAKILQTTIGED